MKEDKKQLDAEELEQVTGGIFTWDGLPKKLKEEYEKEQQKDGGATGGW